MKAKILEKVKKMARNAIFHDVKPLGRWKNYEVVEAIFTDGEVHYVGYPQFILVDGEEMRWCKDVNESIAIMKAFAN